MTSPSRARPLQRQTDWIPKKYDLGVLTPEYGLRLRRDGKLELVTLYRDLTKPGRTKRGFRPVVIERDT